MKKITRATVKSFINKNNENLFLNTKSRFDAMTDGIEDRNAGFLKARKADKYNNYNIGFVGVHFTFSTKNWCESYEDENYIGYRVDNCCGSFIVAIPKIKNAA